ncbi:MAG: hypothetical protein NTV61_00610 [Candidatus Bathyarchaeota archaeon]|nr:hypothetical protein [Candidatus Bathyarchaeota archaeon]
MEAATAAGSESQASSYRLKFSREEFLKLVDIAKPRVIYRRGKNHLFSFDGFVMYSQDCRDEDFRAKIIDAIEFSNYSWAT